MQVETFEKLEGIPTPWPCLAPGLEAGLGSKSQTTSFSQGQTVIVWEHFCIMKCREEPSWTQVLFSTSFSDLL